ncbi:TetR/AcrR family transcriptional regulator [Amycolatopsis sp. NBC_00345]|uniref:TetR/AcrR family transcriptional regulator n=1 Tax=Amycolatopsis sp. NBC_00345 TaxID=2975955 RepID=UPI002E2576E8
MDRERRILEAATEAFYEKGFHGVGVDEIGKRAGLSGPSLYRHFSGKDEILATLLNEALDELVSATVPVHGDPEQDLDRAVRHHITFAVEHRELVNLYQRDVRSLADPWRRPFDRRRSQYTARWEELLSGCYPDAGHRVPVAAQAILGMVFSVSSWPRRTAQSTGVEETLRALTATGLLGLKEGSPGLKPKPASS